MSERKYRKRFTPESHYEMVLRTDAILNCKEVDGLDDIVITPMHEKIIRMFAYHGMSPYEIARTGEVIGKRGPISEDMIRIYVKKFFPDLEYDEKPTKCKRAKDYNHVKRCQQAKKQLLKEAPYCVVCGSTENLELDHILTVSIGGSDDISNLQLLCHKCHCEKTRQEREQFGWNKSALSARNKKRGEIKNE